MLKNVTEVQDLKFTIWQAYNNNPFGLNLVDTNILSVTKELSENSSFTGKANFQIQNVIQTNRNDTDQIKNDIEQVHSLQFNVTEFGEADWLN